MIRIGDQVVDVNVTELRIANLNINYLPAEIGKLKSLTRLEIWDCPNLESIPPEIGNLVSLTGLDIRYCQNLESIPPEIGNLQSLTKLQIWHCSNLESIPPEVGNLQSLTKLFIRFCPNLRSIPPEITLLMERGCEILCDRPDLIEKVFMAYYRPRVETLDIVLNQAYVPQAVSDIFARFISIIKANHSP